ncbi:MAG: hypothetical protein Q8S31_01905 [Alphaproteobacteria bacterium]|nr:hypothetical protein [Alphaproteobacteria bacterium]
MISLLSTYRFLYVLVLGIGVTGGIGWFLAGQQADDAIEIRKPIKWTMPDWKPHPLTQDIQTLKDKEFFGSKKIEEAQPEPEPEQAEVKVAQDWNAIGIIIDGDQSKILIKNAQTKQVESLKIGDKLPDGRILEKIQRDTFILSTGENKEEIRLFPFEPAEANAPDEPVIEDKNDH